MPTLLDLYKYSIQIPVTKGSSGAVTHLAQD